MCCQSRMSRTIAMALAACLWPVSLHAQAPAPMPRQPGPDISHLRIDTPPLSPAAAPAAATAASAVAAERVIAPTTRLAPPERARVSMPAQDGGALSVSLPVTRRDCVSFDDVVAEIIDPLLERAALGGPRPVLIWPGKDSVPPARCGTVPSTSQALGLRQSRASLKDVAPLVAAQSGSDATVSREMVKAFLGNAERAGAEVEAALRTAWSMPFAEYKADIQREEIVYPFMQVICKVPVEHSTLVATRVDGQGITSVHGALVMRPAPRACITPIPFPRALELANLQLQSWADDKRILLGPVDEKPALVLLPSGTDSTGAIRLVYAWRLTLRGAIDKQPLSYRAWLAAEPSRPDWDHGPLLKLQPLIAEADGTGKGWMRDPGTGQVVSRSFVVDDVNLRAGEKYRLQRLPMAARVAFLGPSANAQDVGATGTAVFDQGGMGDAATAVCALGHNVMFEQVNLFGLLSFHHGLAIGAGIYQDFPSYKWMPYVESQGNCSATPTPEFPACAGYYDAACPNYSTGSVHNDNYMNFAHDGTIVGHEVGHSAIRRFTSERPSNWCGQQSCAMPLGWWHLHDLADAWADLVEDTNCTGGWVAKNQGGVNASHNCRGERGHGDANDLPRLHVLTVPFHPASPGDHFPERRVPSAQNTDYTDMEIAAAVLWQVREGMRSLDPASGSLLYFTRFARALRQTGQFSVTDPGNTDRGIYRYLVDLEMQMAYQWATAGSPVAGAVGVTSASASTNKVLAGFARAGLFPIRAECLSNDMNAGSGNACPPGKAGAEAVIDIDDNDPSDDTDAQGVPRPDHDYLRLNGPAPVFHVWTGARYRFVGDDASLSAPAPCHAKFRVEASTDQNFQTNVVQSNWIAVDTDPTTPASPECYGTWSPSPQQWTQLQAGGHLSRVYYRASTSDTGLAGDDERLSTTPAAGTWTLLPPYAVLTTSGRPPF